VYTQLALPFSKRRRDPVANVEAALAAQGWTRDPALARRWLLPGTVWRCSVRFHLTSLYQVIDRSDWGRRAWSTANLPAISLELERIALQVRRSQRGGVYAKDESGRVG